MGYDRRFYLIAIATALTFSASAAALQTAVMGSEGQLTTSSAMYFIDAKGELVAHDRLTSRELWRKKVGPTAGPLTLVNGVLLYRSCVSGAYILCETQGMNAKTGQRLWAIDGDYVGANGRDLLFDVTFPFYAGPQNFMDFDYAVVDARRGERRRTTLKAGPRAKCGDWVGFVNSNGVPKVSGHLLTLNFEDNCGEFARSYRWE